MRIRLPTRWLVFGLLLVVGARMTGAAGSRDPRAGFFDRLSALCGSVFEGYSTFPTDPDHSFAGKLLVANVATCAENEVRIPFAVGEDRSRTWIVSWSSHGLLLEHDHRHADGTPDEITLYGGWATVDGTALEQSFAAHERTEALIPEAATNVWTITLAADGTALTYYLERHEEPRFEATLSRRSTAAHD